MNRKSNDNGQRHGKKEREKNKSGKESAFTSKHVRAQENRMAAAAMRNAAAHANESSKESS